MNQDKVYLSKPNKKSFLCKIGLHKWGKSNFISHGYESNIRDYKKRCQKCGKIKTWIEPK